MDKESTSQLFSSIKTMPTSGPDINANPFEVINNFPSIDIFPKLLTSIRSVVVSTYPQFKIQDTAKTSNSVVKIQSTGQSHHLHNDVGLEDDGVGYGQSKIDDDSQLYAVVSTVFVLNDDYEGGNIFFPEHSVNVRLNAGDLIMWPSLNYMHGVDVVTGEKSRYSFVSWWYPSGTISSD